MLSESQDPREAAARLFGCMRRLDESGVSEIVAQLVPEAGLAILPGLGHLGHEEDPARFAALVLSLARARGLLAAPP